MKKKKKEDIGSLDSLLDTITTVVGILIILLIVVQLGADTAVKRIVDEKKEENSKELIELAMKQFEEQKNALLAEKKKLQLQQAFQNKDQQKLIEEISKLEKEVSQKKNNLPPLPPKLQNLSIEKNKLSSDKKTIELKVKKIKGLLVSAPKGSSQSLSRDISLPEPKPATPGSKPFRFLCRGEKIFSVDDISLQNRVKSLVAQSGLKANKDKEYDGTKFLKLINGKKVGNPFFEVKAKSDSDKVIRFVIERKPSSGEDEASLLKPNSKYLKALSTLNPTKHYLLFEVFPDSFGAYLAARDLANQRKFPAGWKPANRPNDWWSFDWGYRVIGRKAYLASRPKPKPSTGKPVAAKKPANVLD
jgi:hypothetical protein